MFAVGAILEEG